MKHPLRRALAAGLAWLFVTAPAFAGVTEDHYGKWLGKITIPNGPTLSVGVEFLKRADGTPGGRLVSPDQGVFNLPLDRVSEAGGAIDVIASAVGVSLHLQASGDRLEGEAHQGPTTMPVSLSRVADFGEPARPQTPKPPFPYRTESLSVVTKDGVVLSGALSRPDNDRPATVVVLLHGSGPADRDEGVAGHEPFAVLADYLVRQGVAVFRYDKRGVMRSTGDYASATEVEFAADGAAVVAALRARKDVARVGVLGHSEGGLLAAWIAAEHPRNVAFVISLAGPGLTGVDEMLLQDRVGYERRGLPPAQIVALTAYGKRFYDIVLADEDPATRMMALTALQSGLKEADLGLVRQYASQGTLSLQMAATPALRQVLSSDAPALWRRVRCPVLALNGELDVQVPPRQNLRAIKQALGAGGHSRVQVGSLPGLNHLFQTAKTGLADEYSKIDETMSPAVLKRVAAFLSRKL